MSSRICVIPARAGSKRLPCKNSREFHGRPLASWTFAFADDCHRFAGVVLSTDDPRVAALAPPSVTCLSRPLALASDTATLLEVVRHVIVDVPLAPDDVVVLTPVTAPLRTLNDLDRSIDAFERHGRRRTVLTVGRNPHPPHLLWTMDDDGGLGSILDRAAFGTRKQAFLHTYFWNDAFLIDTAAGLLSATRDLYGPDPIGVAVPRERSVPIDDAYDFWLAEQLFDPASFLKG